MDIPSYTFLVLFFILATSGFGENIESRAEVIDENLKRLATANNELAFNIYRQLTNGSQENVFFSPLSLSTAFGMLYYGTRGDTAKELRNALGYERAGLEDGLVHQTFQKYLTETLPSQDTTAYTLNSANAALIDKKLDLVPEYKTKVQDYYQASVQDVDFAAQGPEVVRQINEWVREKTNGKIDKLLEALDTDTLLVLLNAVYFKGTWKTAFDPSVTRPFSFYNNGLESGKTETAMMKFLYGEDFPYVQADGFKVLEMPYKGDNISMLLLLPNELDGLQELERSLTATKLLELRSRLVEKEVHLTFPKFKLQYSRELSEAFQSVGARKIFEHAADFSGITKWNADIAVSQVLHKADIEVNEEGSEATAITHISLAIRSRRRTNFTVDHPFLFAIIDRRNDMILFLGRVTNL